MHGTLSKLPARSSKRQPVLHVVMPGLEVARVEPLPRETVTAFLRRSGWATRDRKYGWQFKKGLPTILEINGEAVLRKDWRRRRIRVSDSVRFVSYPLGGNGGAKQVIGLVALVAVAAFAGPLGASIASALALPAIAGTFIGAGIAIGGSLLINALTTPKAGATNAPDAKQDQIYSVQAQGNAAKLGQPLPIWYGRLKDCPDFAATPWGEFVGNDQYLNVLLSVSMGSMEYETLYVDDTVLWTADDGISESFPGAQIEFYEPGEDVTLFPTNVDQSDEVSGQELPDGTGGWNPFSQADATPGAALGPFVANPAGTQAQSLAIDIVLPAGCFAVQHDSDGGSSGNVVTGPPLRLTAEYAPVDDAGAVIGGYSTLFDVFKTYTSKSPVRDSIKVDVAPGRYTVRVYRWGKKLDLNGDGNNNAVWGQNGVVWAGLRSFLKGSNSFPDVSTVAIRLKASQSTQGSFKFGVLGTRKLPVWDGSTFTTQATRSPSWAFLDAVTSSQYGSGLSIAKADFNAVVNHAAGCAARGDTFDYRFTTATAIPDALDKILTPSRSRHFWLGDTISVVRDEWRDVPTMLLTDREIVRDSTQVTFTMLGDEDPDAVIVEYVDENTWRAAQVQYPPNVIGTFVAENAEVKRIDGIVNRDQAFRECAFYYLQSVYRRENVQIATEYEGRAITFGSVLRIQSELPQNYGYGGAVTGVSSHTLTLSPAPVWDTGPFYIRLRQPSGKSFGPVLCTQGDDASHAVLNVISLAAAEADQGTTLADVLSREDGAEYPSFELGTGVNESKLCVVLNGAPSGDHCTLSLVVDDERVHTTDLGSPPIPPVGQFPSNPRVPVIAGLNAVFTQGTAEPKLHASWFPSAGAEYYVADISYDSGSTWTQIYEGIGNIFEMVVSPAALRLRVQAITPGAVRGPYSTVDLDAPTIVIASETVALQSLVDGIRYQVTTLQDQFNDELAQVRQTLSNYAAGLSARDVIDKKELRSQLSARSDAAFAEIEDVRTVAVDTETAFASFQTTVTAQFADVNASITTNASAISTLNGYAAAAYSVTLDVNGYATGFELVNGGLGTSSFTVVSDKFQIQLPGYNGGVPVPVFTVGTINGAAAIGINGANMFLDGTLNARAIVAGTVDSTRITAGTITSASGVIGALGVRSLSIADNAVTVPVAQSLGGNVSAISPGTPQTYFSFNLTIDTTGLAGKNVVIYASVSGMWANGSVATETGQFYLLINGSVANGYAIATPSGTLALVSLGGAINITASGGVMSIPVQTQFYANSATYMQAGTTIYAQAAKR